MELVAHMALVQPVSSVNVVRRTMTHWGVYDLQVRDGQIVDVEPWSIDPDPSPLGRSLTAVSELRVRQPVARRGWLERGPEARTQRRGADDFIPLSWDQALDLVAGELDRVRRGYGNMAIYAGSYGWA